MSACVVIHVSWPKGPYASAKNDAGVPVIDECKVVISTPQASACPIRPSFGVAVITVATAPTGGAVGDSISAWTSWRSVSCPGVVMNS